MTKPPKNPALYILMRTDMDSLTPGKAMAQAAHAANQFQTLVGNLGSAAADMWSDQADGFGTTIILGVDSLREMDEVVESALEEEFHAGMVLDSSYPIRDGKVVHHLSIYTCAFVFTECRDTNKVSSLAGLTLYK